MARAGQPAQVDTRRNHRRSRTLRQPDRSRRMGAMQWVHDVFLGAWRPVREPAARFSL